MTYPCSGPRLILVGAAFLGAADTGLSKTDVLRLVPPPKEVRWSQTAPLSLENAAIVIGDGAQPPERYAADMLERHVARRFCRQWAIVSENEGSHKYNPIILLGQRTSNRWLDRLCREKGINLNETSPGHDGYVIEPLAIGDQNVIIVGGSNARGVIYGQDTLFQMLTRSQGGLAWTRASVRDWPSVPWRGRPQTHFMNYLRAGDLDCYMESRINFIDLRNDTYAFEPGAELDKANLSRVIEEARRRGLIVYGTVNCGVPRHEYAAAMRTFKEFISLGVDGLWVSFDDKGPGESPELIVTDVLELGRQHGITGNRVAICPPKGSYQDIVTEFNERIMAIPGMEKASWFWTRWPSARHLAQARSIGLDCKPAWWHNWPRLHTPHRYIEPPSMAVGWHAPSYDMLADGGRYVDAVMPWGGNAWGPHYIIPVIGWWGWSPGQHDWPSTRSRIYDIVFGPGQVATATAFDDTLVQTKSLLRYSTRGSRWQPCCPVRLIKVEDRQKVLAQVRKMRDLLGDLKKKSPGATMLDPEQLGTFYLDRMEAELQTIETGARLPYPEYWWEPHQRNVLTAIYDGDLARANERVAAVRNRLLDEVAEVAKATGELGRVDEYVSWWRERAGLDAQGWQNLVAERREELARRVSDYSYYVAVPSAMLAPLREPPLDWGSGRWQTSNRVLATVLPTEREFAWGNWIGGLYHGGDLEAAVFAARRKSQSMAGEFSELELVLPVSGRRDRLALLLFINHANKDAIGAQHTTARWAGYRFVELLWDDKLVWEADVGLPRENGEWFMVDLPVIPEDVATLTLRLRVVDRRMLTVNHTIVFVGPIRLIERQE